MIYDSFVDSAARGYIWMSETLSVRARVREPIWLLDNESEDILSTGDVDDANKMSDT